MKKLLLGSTALTIFAISIIIFQISCKKVDDALNYALNFEGVFASANGNEIVLETEPSNKGSGKFTKIGTSTVGLGVGDYFCSDMERVNENTWKGQVRETSGGSFNFLTYGEISMNDNGNLLTISPNGGAIYNYTRVSSGGTGGGGTGTNTEILVNQCVSGSVGDKKIFQFNVPANVTKMEIKTFEETGTCDRNAADLFVRKGSQPTITSTTPYVWVADPGGAGIKPNREDELCVFNNPGSGTWYVMLFGYNTFFISKLKITITK
ncbi:MAG TPA: PPC domain-containing protein [Chitinophagaceae bacterium]